MCSSVIVRSDYPTLVSHIKQCQCGAVNITMENPETGRDEQFSMRLKTFREKFYNFRISKKSKYYACDHCVNHYGIDLCACGSGKHPDKCKEGYSECGNPKQYLPI